MLSRSLGIIKVAIEREFEMVDCFILRKAEVSFFSTTDILENHSYTRKRKTQHPSSICLCAEQLSI